MVETKLLTANHGYGIFLRVCFFRENNSSFYPTGAA